MPGSPVDLGVGDGKEEGHEFLELQVEDVFPRRIVVLLVGHCTLLISRLTVIVHLLALFANRSAYTIPACSTAEARFVQISEIRGRESRADFCHELHELKRRQKLDSCKLVKFVAEKAGRILATNYTN
ncbi:hypothetical protein [Candidatus Amarolinea dominans]|uniref:hypothetical protein n=1 Tax=Candidatus Amarolinea dominans TaxID=3140696 RepID=UPI0031368890|nr:hypothetical protein [Anaerolineae bacterium]